MYGGILGRKLVIEFLWSLCLRCMYSVWVELFFGGCYGFCRIWYLCRLFVCLWVVLVLKGLFFCWF